MAYVPHPNSLLGSKKKAEAKAEPAWVTGKKKYLNTTGIFKGMFKSPSAKANYEREFWKFGEIVFTDNKGIEHSRPATQKERSIGPMFGYRGLGINTVYRRSSLNPSQALMKLAQQAGAQNTKLLLSAEFKTDTDAIRKQDAERRRMRGLGRGTTSGSYSGTSDFNPTSVPSSPFNFDMNRNVPLLNSEFDYEANFGKPTADLIKDRNYNLNVILAALRNKRSVGLARKNKRIQDYNKLIAGARVGRGTTKSSDGDRLRRLMLGDVEASTGLLSRKKKRK